MQRKYNSSQSHSHKEDGKLFTASYGSGAVNGFTSIDQIKVLISFHFHPNVDILN